MKKFLIIGNMNAIAYKEIFPYIKKSEMWLGATNFNTGMYFRVPDNFVYAASYKFERELNGERVNRVPGCCWYTNLDHKKRHEPIDLYKHYNKEEYPKYDNYDAINVNKVSDIPMDYNGVMGVPISFLDKYCSEQFEIIDLNPHFFSIVESGLPKPKQLTLHNVGKKNPYARVLIKKKDMKKFLIIGNMNAITYKEIFPLIKDNKIWAGCKPFAGGMNMIQNKENFDQTKTKSFYINEKGEIIKNIIGCIWFTNLSNNNHKIPITLTQTYSSDKYPKYDNYNAINVDKVKDIPMDYYGLIGVPITFLDKYCPEQFEIIGCCEPCIDIKIYKKCDYFKNIPSRQIKHNGILCQKTYHRLLIKRRFIDINI